MTTTATTADNQRTNNMNTTNTGTLNNSDRGSAGALLMIGLGLLALIWSFGWLAPVSSIAPGAPDSENQAGNDFLNGFKQGYSNATTDPAQPGPAEVAQS